MAGVALGVMAAVAASATLWATYQAGRTEGEATGRHAGFEDGLAQGQDESCAACEKSGYAQGAAETAYEIMEAVARQKEAEANAKRERADQALVGAVLGGEVLS